MARFVTAWCVLQLFVIGVSSAQDATQFEFAREAARKAVSRKSPFRRLVAKGDEALMLGQNLALHQNFPAAAAAFHEALALYPPIPICQPRRKEALTCYLNALGTVLGNAGVPRQNLNRDPAVRGLPNPSPLLPELTAAINFLYPDAAGDSE
jgi:hypothetical protein